jgi:hypothetical protein
MNKSISIYDFLWDFSLPKKDEENQFHNKFYLKDRFCDGETFNISNQSVNIRYSTIPFDIGLSIPALLVPDWSAI